MHEGEVKVKVLRRWGKYKEFSQLERQKREIAGKFRDNVRVSKGFEAIRRNCRRNTACYRVGWVLARHLNSIFLSVLQSIPHIQPSRALESPSQASVSLSLPTASPLKATELSLSRHSSPSRSLKRSTFLISQLVVNKPVLRKLAGILLGTAFERIKVVEFRGNAKELGKAYSSRAGEDIGNSHSGEVARKTAELTQRVASIMQLIEAKKAETASEQPSSRSSQANTPRRALNLRIPNQSSLSTSPVSPTSALGRESEEKGRGNGSFGLSEESIYADLTELRRKERTLRVWKQWKAVLMRGKITKLKVEIGLKSRFNRLFRHILSAFHKWTDYRRSKKQWISIAVQFHCKTLLSQSFRLLSVQTSRHHLFSLASKHHIHRSLGRLVTLWANYARIKALREAKVRTILDRVEDRIRYKFIAVWKLAGKFSAKCRERKEKALFFWYETKMPIIWKELKKAVQKRKIAGKMKKIAERLRESLLKRTFFPLWQTAVLHSIKLTQKETKLKRLLCVKRAKLGLKRLFDYAKRLKKWRNFAEMAEKRGVRGAKHRTLQRLRQGQKLNQACRALADKVAEAETWRLGKEAWKCWKLRVKRKAYENNSISTSKSRRKVAFMRLFLLNWQIALRNRLSKQNNYGKNRRISALRVCFQSLKQVTKASMGKKELLLSSLAAMRGTTLTRLVSAWRQLAQKKQTYMKNRAFADRFYKGKVYTGWRQRYKQVLAMRKVLSRRLKRANWDLWVGNMEEFTTQEKMQNRAKRHFRLRILRKILPTWAGKHEKARKFAFITKQIQQKGRKQRLKGLFQAWVEEIPKIQRKLRLQRLATDFATAHSQQIVSQLLHKFQSYHRRSTFLQQRTSTYQLRAALTSFHIATSTSQLTHRAQRSLLVRAETHLKATRSHRALDALRFKVSRKQLCRGLLWTAELAQGRRGWLRWQAYRRRYFALVRKAEEFRQEREALLAVETFQRLAMLLKRRNNRDNLQEKVNFGRNCRFGRVLQAWKRAITGIQKEKAGISSLRRKVILKSCIKVMRHNCKLLNSIKTFLLSHVSASDSKLKSLSFLSFQQNLAWNRASQAIQTHHRATTLHLSLISWQTTAKSSKICRSLLSARLKQWTARKQYDCVMAYVQPRLRGSLGSKLTALWKWKLALDSQSSPRYMHWLLPKSTATVPESQLVLVFGLWRGVAGYMGLYRQLQVVLFRRRVLQGRGWTGWRTRVRVGRLRLKKTVTAALFSDLKREMRAFRGWKGLRATSETRSRSASSRKGVPKVC